MDVIDHLNEIQSFALLDRIEEVLRGDGEIEIEERFASVYKKCRPGSMSRLATTSSSTGATTRR